jgi:PKHD-type hydroxylase
MYPLESDTNLIQNDHLCKPVIIDMALTDEQIDQLVNLIKAGKVEAEKGEVEAADEDGEDGYDSEARIVDMHFMGEEETYDLGIEWLFPELEAIALEANRLFNFDLHGFPETINVLHYHTKDPDGAGHFYEHTDIGSGDISTRKLTIIIQLSNEEEYEGATLNIADWGDAPKTRGTAIVFPAYMSHGVEPIESGERFCLNAWVHGHAFR